MIFNTPNEGHQKVKICLMGASFETGNLGVNAIAESAIKIILNRWPDAQIIFLGSGYKPCCDCLSIAGKEKCIETLPVRFSKNIFLPYHFLRLAFCGLLIKVLPGVRAKKTLLRHNPYFKILYESDLVADITGGDSFSDIYGMHRFITGFLRKWLVILAGRKLVMLPQTYGPFKRRITKMLAKYILKHSAVIHSRDVSGAEYAKKILGNHNMASKVQFTPDVAFVLDSCEPKELIIEPSAIVRTKNNIVAGLNISGLLFNGGCGGNNVFGLKTDYKKLIYQVIEQLMKHDNVVVLLIPHVFPEPGNKIESDFDACLKVFHDVGEKYKGRIFLVKGQYNHNEIKYIIGNCDFLIGSRMHACIAALSQGIPAVGLAYSKKFEGVFESAGAENLVIDLCQSGENEIFAKLKDIFEKRDAIGECLSRTVPGVQARILSIFKDF